MPEAKTKPTDQSVDSFIKRIPDPASTASARAACISNVFQTSTCPR